MIWKFKYRPNLQNYSGYNFFNFHFPTKNLQNSFQSAKFGKIRSQASAVGNTIVSHQQVYLVAFQHSALPMLISNMGFYSQIGLRLPYHFVNEHAADVMKRNIWPTIMVWYVLQYFRGNRKAEESCNKQKYDFVIKRTVKKYHKGLSNVIYNRESHSSPYAF